MPDDFGTARFSQQTPLPIPLPSLQLAGNLLPQEIYPGVSVTSLSGMLSSKNNKHVLHPHPVAVGKQLWGQTSVEATIQALREVWEKYIV